MTLEEELKHSIKYRYSKKRIKELYKQVREEYDFKTEHTEDERLRYIQLFQEYYDYLTEEEAQEIVGEENKTETSNLAQRTEVQSSNAL